MRLINLIYFVLWKKFITSNIFITCLVKIILLTVKLIWHFLKKLINLRLCND